MSIGVAILLALLCLTIMSLISHAAVGRRH
jgi:hypothetical protein